MRAFTTKSLETLLNDAYHTATSTRRPRDIAMYYHLSGGFQIGYFGHTARVIRQVINNNADKQGLALLEEVFKQMDANRCNRDDCIAAKLNAAVRQFIPRFAWPVYHDQSQSLSERVAMWRHLSENSPGLHVMFNASKEQCKIAKASFKTIKLDKEIDALLQRAHAIKQKQASGTDCKTAKARLRKDLRQWMTIYIQSNANRLKRDVAFMYLMDVTFRENAIPATLYKHGAQMQARNSKVHIEGKAFTVRCPSRRLGALAQALALLEDPSYVSAHQNSYPVLQRRGWRSSREWITYDTAHTEAVAALPVAELVEPNKAAVSAVATVIDDAEQHEPKKQAGTANTHKQAQPKQVNAPVAATAAQGSVPSIAELEARLNKLKAQPTTKPTSKSQVGGRYGQLFPALPRSLQDFETQPSSTATNQSSATAATIHMVAL